MNNIDYSKLKNEPILAVKCDICGQLHEAESNKFVTIHGNITVGLGGGIIGNNFDKDGHLFRQFIFCDTRDCMQKFIDKINLSKHDFEDN